VCRPTGESGAQWDDQPNAAGPHRRARFQVQSDVGQSEPARAGLPEDPVSLPQLLRKCQQSMPFALFAFSGFDQDCSLQLMVNLALRTRCLAREPRPDQWSLPLCGNGLREGNEQCDCGLATKCAEWNCEPQTCARHWPLWAMVSQKWGIEEKSD
jgi:hypothetical protein